MNEFNELSQDEYEEIKYEELKTEYNLRQLRKMGLQDIEKLDDYISQLFEMRKHVNATEPHKRERESYEEGYKIGWNAGYSTR